MAHEITDTDNLFTTYQPAWHGLGHTFPDYPTREEAQAIAHPWEPVEEKIYTRLAGISPEGDVYEGFDSVDGYKAVVRSDNSAPIGVVSDSYQVVSNNELWDIAEALEGSADDVMFETGGSLKGGSKTWLMLRLKEPLEIPGDPNGSYIPYYSLQNSHDGSGALRGQATNTRIVCANTAQIADLNSRARGTEFTFRHSKNVKDRIDQAKEALLGWRTGLQDHQAKMEHLLTLGLSDAGVREFEERFFPEPPPAMGTDRVLRNVFNARNDWRDVLNSWTNEGIENTAYGLVQATIEYSEHVRKARSNETKFKRTVLDRNQVIQKAVDLAEKVA